MKRRDRRERTEEERALDREEEAKKRLEGWVAKTELGKMVRDGKIETMDEIFDRNLKIMEPEIVDALVKMPIRFRGNELDKVAPLTASAWPEKDYSPLRFRQRVCELGIVGRERRLDEQARIIEADFEYYMSDRLVVQPKDWCVIHPMFHEKLRTVVKDWWLIYPFPDHPSFRGVF